MSRAQTLAILFALIAAHIVLGAYYAAVTPYRTAGILLSERHAPAVDIGAPDERQHVNYVIQLHDGKGFPVFDLNAPDKGETYENHQPPAYYVLASGWASLLGAGDLTSRDGGLKLRSLNVVLGAMTVAGVFFVAYWGYRRPEVGLVAAAFAALLPMLTAMSGAVSNDPLLFLLCTWTLAFVVKGLRDGWTMKLGIAVGLLAALAVLTKTTALALFPVLLLAVVVKQEAKPKPAVIATAVALAILLPLPWWLRNQHLYGDPFAIKVFNEAFTGSPQASMFIQGFGPFGYWVDFVLWWTARSFIGVFGYMDIWLTNTGLPYEAANGVYLLGFLLLAVAFVGWLGSLKESAEPSERSVHWVEGAFALVTVVLFLRFNAQYFQAQARYVFPAIAPIACGVGLGLMWITRKRFGVALGAVVVVLGFIQLFAITRLPAEFQKRTPGAVSLRTPERCESVRNV